jgi:hypothetical protein
VVKEGEEGRGMAMEVSYLAMKRGSQWVWRHEYVAWLDVRWVDYVKGGLAWFCLVKEKL